MSATATDVADGPEGDVAAVAPAGKRYHPGAFIEMLCSSILSVQSQIQTGRLKVLAVMSDKRSPELPSVAPT